MREPEAAGLAGSEGAQPPERRTGLSYGAGDAVSVVIRHSLVQTRTPHEMLGRVLAVNFMFTGTSGTLGEFRAGTVAALFGAFTSVLVGGVGAIVVALFWMKLFPELRRIDTIQSEPD